MSLRLNEKLKNPGLRGTLLHLHGDHVNFWRRHISTDMPILEQAFLACLEVGNLVYAGFLAFETVWQAIEKGDTLQDVLALSMKYAAFAQESHNEAVYETIRLEQQFVASLQGRTTDPMSFEDSAFDEEACFAAIVKATFGCGIVFHHIMKQILAFVHGRQTEALEAAAQAEPMLGAAMAMPIEATYHFYHALTLTALYPAASSAQQAEYRLTLGDKLKKLQLWAWYDVDEQISLSRLLSELFPERAKEAVPRGSPAPCTREFLGQILLNDCTSRIWPEPSALVRTL